MSYVNKGSMPVTVTVSKEPDRSGNFVCDGTNDELQIIAAIGYINALGGGVIQLLQGTYYFSDVVTISSNIDLIGAGRGATVLDMVEASGGRVRFATGCQDAAIRHLSIEIRDNQSLEGVDVDGITLEDLYVRGGGATYFTAYFHTTADWNTNCLLLECTFTKDPSHASAQDTFGGGQWKHWRIVDCDFSGTGKAGYGNIGLSCRDTEDVLICNCRFHDNPASGTSLEDGQYSHYVNCVSRDNNGKGFYIDLVNATPPLLEIGYYNCRAISNNSHGFQLERCDFSVIYGIARSNGGSGVAISGSQFCDVHIIADNNTEDGVLLSQGGTGRSVLYNKVAGIISNNGGYGVSEGTGTVDYNRIMECLFYNNTTGAVNIRGDHTQVPELWVPIVDDSHAQVSKSNIGEHFSIMMATGQDATFRFNFRVPINFHEVVEGKIEMVPDAADPTLRWSLATDWGRCGQSYSSDSGSIAVGTSELTQNVIHCLDITAALAGVGALEPGDQIGVTFTRDIDAVDDAGNVHVLGFWLKYV